MALLCSLRIFTITCVALNFILIGCSSKHTKDTEDRIAHTILWEKAARVNGAEDLKNLKVFVENNYNREGISQRMKADLSLFSIFIQTNGTMELPKGLMDIYLKFWTESFSISGKPITTLRKMSQDSSYNSQFKKAIERFSQNYLFDLAKRSRVSLKSLIQFVDEYRDFPSVSVKAVLKNEIEISSLKVNKKVVEQMKKNALKIRSKQHDLLSVLRGLQFKTHRKKRYDLISETLLLRELNGDKSSLLEKSLLLFAINSLKKNKNLNLREDEIKVLGFSSSIISHGMRQ
jgi:hypothetical protein